MQEAIPYIHRHLQLDQDDQQALNLFNNVELELSKSQQIHQPLQNLNQSHNSIDSAPRFSRLSKLKGESKRQKKHKKKKQKLRLKKKRHHRQGQLSAPKKKIKREGSSKKQKGSDDGKLSGDGDHGSSQFDSQSSNQVNLNEELKNLNPDYAEKNSQQDKSPKKRLVKSGRKQRIQQRQGFKISQLGINGKVSLSENQNSEDQSYEGKKSKKLKKKKLKVPTNQQIMNAFKEHGVVESEDQGQKGQERQYDSGLDMLNSLKSKKSNNGIRINNRLFGDLEINLQNQQAQMPLPQNLELQLKPKNSVSSQRFSFLSRAETIKKQRGLEADVNLDQFQRIAQQKAKKSMAKVVSSMVSQQFHDDLDVQIRVPTIARGKSADIINNTVFLRKFANKIENNDLQQTQILLMQTKSMGQPTFSKKEGQSRHDFFKEIQEQNRLRRSKYISQDQLKNSFKKTNLQELQEARKRIQQKKRKQALSDQSENEQEIDSNLQQMIEKQEIACGDINQEQQAGDENKEQKAMVEVSVSVQIKEIPQEELENHENGLQKENEELQQYKEVIQQLQSDSEGQQQEDPIQNEEASESINSEPENQLSQGVKQSPEVQNAEQKQIQINQQNEENEKVMRQLLEQGIIYRKRGFNKLNGSQLIPKPQQSILNQNLQPQMIKQTKQNEELISTNKKEDYDEQDEEFNNFRKLRKIAKVIAKKKKEREEGRKYASQFIEQEAEEGSDNEQHDDFVKKIDYDEEDKQFEGMNLDEDLEELIDNFVDLNQENQFEAFRKYLEDVRLKDKEQIRKIIRGQFHKKHEDLEIEMEEDEKKRQERMEEVMNWMKKRQDEEGENLYLKSPERQNSDSEDQSSNFSGKRKKVEVQAENEEQKVQLQEQLARLQKFISQTLPSSKRELKPAKQLNFFPFPESVKLEKKPSSQKAISMSKLGSKIASQASSQQLMNLKNTSSLVNKILNKNHSYKPKSLLAAAPVKNGKKK